MSKNFKILIPSLILTIVLLAGMRGRLAAEDVASLGQPQGFVNDYVGLLNSQDSSLIESRTEELSRQTSAEITLVTVRTTKPEPIEDFAVKLFKRWGIGKKKDDNGALLLVAYDDRQVRVEVGYGLEGVLTDAFCKNVIEEIILPSFRQGQFSQGVREGSLALLQEVGNHYGLSWQDANPNIAQQATSNGDYQVSDIFVILFLFFVFFIFIYSSRYRRGSYYNDSYWYGGRGYGGFGGGLGGGFGGFGGGLSGGGGATGRW